MLKYELLNMPHPFFHGMCDHHLRRIAELAVRTHFPRGTVIFREGELANRFYLIQHGKVSLETSTNRQSPIAVQTLTDGDVLGWSWMFAPYLWHFDAVAVDETDALFICGVRLREECEADKAFGYEIMKRVTELVIRRLEAARLKLADATFSEAETLTSSPS